MEKERIIFTPETEVYVRNMHNPNKPLHGYIREVISMAEINDLIPERIRHEYDVDISGTYFHKRESLINILYAKCADNWYAIKDLIEAAEKHCPLDKPLRDIYSRMVGKYCAPTWHTPCVKDMVYELEHDNVDCELHNRVYYIDYASMHPNTRGRNLRYYDIPTFDLSADYIRKHKDDYFSTPSPSEQLKKKLKRIEVNGDYMTAVWYDQPATVIKLSENDMYDTEKAYMWLLLKGLCENNKSECDRILKLMEDITYVKNR